MSNKKGKKKAPKVTPTAPISQHVGDVDVEVKEWMAKAPKIVGLRRPGVRVKVIAMFQGLDAKGFMSEEKVNSQRVAEDYAEIAEIVADVDELLATLGGAEYVEFIEQISMKDGLQMAVMFEMFSDIAADLGKG